ncbi:hypothetical protein IW140_002588 [Coemansia sp. RSA 1813]|nr:hypothetical protein EV178_002084 [Coemansia sp. RSA 1646]KAJ1772714.1 hypothetical protein LPJ74_001240 [Coemansia sp. RSA 1843]KAJ2090664.1 hypothetical protein IW138_002478 [Coemansia sp. RSA 986]KAJ2216131.1 hypothetical protein EV179_001591 [Coemansia sp. RSA 487]KAJ2570118.1 hypothetical protein IW140_002588 [Coemansia sp. RSA 1813]
MAAQQQENRDSVKAEAELQDTGHSPLVRIRMEPIDRLATMATVSFGAGALCGGYLGGKHAGRQYLAERAHRLPTTVEGWYFYQKWKNYRVTLGAFRGAVNYGVKMSACVMAFSSVEALIDRMVGETQAASSIVAGVSTAVGISLATRLPRSSARRACMAGLCVGLLTGAAQDAGRWASGSTPAYIVWAQKRISMGK